MLEFIGAFVLTWWFVIGLGIFTLIVTHNDADAWSLFGVILLAIVGYFFFSLTLKQLLIGVVAYIPIGLAWSIYRWKRHCKYEYDQYLEDPKKDDRTWRYSKDRITTKLDPTKNIGKIANWVIIWPFSFIDNIIGDLIDMMEAFIKKYIIGIYQSISGKYLDQL